MGLLWLYSPFLCKHQGIGVVGLDTYTWGIKDFHKCWSGSLAKRRLCLGPAGVINCTPLSVLSFWVSLLPGKCGYNIVISWLLQPLHFLWLQHRAQTGLPWHLSHDSRFWFFIPLAAFPVFSQGALHRCKPALKESPGTADSSRSPFSIYFRSSENQRT